MVIPEATHPGWVKLISGDLKCDFELLSVKILVGRLNVSYKNQPTQEVMQKCIVEARNFFEKNQNLEKAAKDLSAIFNQGVH